MSTARDRPPEEASEDTSFARGLRILLTVADRAGIRAGELSTLLDTPLSTVYRYLRTLTEFGFVERRGAEYRLGPRVLIGGGANVTTAALIHASNPVLRMLAEETGETALLMRRVGLSAVCLDAVEPPKPLRVAIEVGAVFPLYAGAIQRALLAFAPPEVLEEVLANGLPDAGDSAIDVATLRDELADIVTTRLAKSGGNEVQGIVTVAVPIMKADGIAAALGVSGPEVRCGLSWRTRVGRMLPDAAQAIVSALGG